MSSAKPIFLNVKPYRVTQVCFEVDGILQESHTELGSSVNAFDFAKFYATLGGIPTNPGDPSRIRYDFLQIQAAVKPYMLAALRSEPRKAALNKAINARQNAYFGKYANAPGVITLMNQFYSPAVAGSKPNRLVTLSSLASLQATQLNTAYTSDGRTGVVKTTKSILESEMTSSASSKESGQTNMEAMASAVSTPTSLPPLPAGGGAIAASFTGPLAVNESFDEGTSSLQSSSRGTASQHQTIENTDYGYRTPLLESQAQNERAQISLIDQRFAQFMASQSLPYLGQVFANELQSMDGDVFTLQVAFLNTMLMSPIDGIVTGVYKNPGDAVRAADPVYRVEDPSTIYLNASLKFRGAIGLGSTLTVQTSLFDAAGPLTTIAGNVVASRGYDEDDRWDVTAKCNNLDGGGNPIFPLGYHFDYDNTTVSIT